MKKLFESALTNLKRHPAGYTIVALVLLITVVIIPQLQGIQKLMAFCVAVLACVFVIYLLRRQESDDSERVKFFPPGEQGKYNRAAYDFFKKIIDEAKHDIYITGEGFECADPEGAKLAQDFSAAFDYALKRGVSVVRIQTRPRPTKEWADLLAKQVRQYHDKLCLYVLSDETASQMSSVCVIDPDSPDSSWVGIMLATQVGFGEKIADLLGPALFLRGTQSFARDVRNRILDLGRSKASIQVKTYKETIKIFSGENR